MKKAVRTKSSLSCAAVFVCFMMLAGCNVLDNQASGPVLVQVEFQVGQSNQAQFALAGDFQAPDTSLILAVPAGTSSLDWAAQATAYDSQTMDIASQSVTLTVPANTSIQLVQMDFGGSFSVSELVALQPAPSMQGISSAFSVTTTSGMTVAIPFTSDNVLTANEKSFFTATELDALYVLSVADLVSQGITLSNDNNTKLARAYFKLAEFKAGSTDSNDANAARFFHGIIRLGSFAFNSASDGTDTNGLQSIGDVLDAMSCATTTRNVYDSTDANNISIECPEFTTTLSPLLDNSAEAQDALINILFNEWEGAIKNMGNITSSFAYSWTQSDGSVTQLDYGDALAAKAFLRAGLASVLIEYSFNLSVAIPASTVVINTAITDYFSCSETYQHQMVKMDSNGNCAYDPALKSDPNLATRSTCIAAHPGGYYDWGWHSCLYDDNYVSLEKALLDTNLGTTRNPLYIKRAQAHLIAGVDEADLAVDSIYGETDGQSNDFITLDNGNGVK